MTPQLRFPEFTDEWQVEKLGDLVKIFDGTHQTPVYVDVGVPFYSVEHVTANDFTNTKLISDSVFAKEKNRPEYGDILMTRIGDIGTSRYLNWNVRASYYVSLALIKSSDRINSKYLNSFISTSFFQNELWKRTIHVAFPKKINLGEISNCVVNFPSTLEQEKIAGFLTVVDERLQLIEKRVELLKKYKNGIMQKIFPTKVGQTPQVRFKDENGNPYPDWQEKKLGLYINDYKQSSKVQNEYPVMTSSRSGIILQKDYYGDDNRVTDRDNIGYNVLPPNYLTYRSRSDDGKFRFNLNSTGKKGIVSYFYPVFDIKNGSNKFFEEYLNIKWKLLYIFSVGTSQKVLAHTALKKIELLAPCKSEQQKIADFLSSIDVKIKLEETKLEQAKLFKKSLLQRMFV